MKPTKKLVAFRMLPAEHARLKIAAIRANMTVDQYIHAALAAYTKGGKQ